MRQSFVMIILIGCFFIIAYASMTFIFQAIKIIEREELEEKALENAIIGVDESFNRAITHCENNGLGCHESIPNLLEQCQEEDMKEITSCHDGRLEQLMNSRVVTMSNECHLRLGMIQDAETVQYGDFDQAAYLKSIDYFEELCGNYNTLLDRLN
jgi:hypothetical protein